MINTPKQRAVCIIAAGLCTALCIVQAKRWSAANADLERVLRDRQQVQADAETIQRLRQRELFADLTPQGTPDINAVIEALSSQHLGRLPRIARIQVETPVRIEGTTYERASASVTLSDVTPAESALILHHWRSAAPVWTPVRVRLVRTNAGRNAGEEPSFDLALSLQCLTVTTQGDTGR